MALLGTAMQTYPPPERPVHSSCLASEPKGAFLQDLGLVHYMYTTTAEG